MVHVGEASSPTPKPIFSWNSVSKSGVLKQLSLVALQEVEEGKRTRETRAKYRMIKQMCILPSTSLHKGLE